MTRPRILVTGGTGFLGKKVIPLLREKFEVDVLSRSGKTEVQGDLTQWNAGLDFDSLKNKKYSLFLHMAGLYDLTASKVDCYQHNISTMGTALKVAEALNIPFFLSTSTVAAGVNSSLTSVKPFDLNFSKPFPDAYSESKALGEQVLHNWPVQNVKGRINLRLGVLVGDTKTGTIERIDGPYYAAEAFKKIRTVIESIPTAVPLPGNPDVRLPLVPVDKAAAAIVKFCEWALTEKPQGYLSYHVTPTYGLGAKEFYISALKNQAIPHKGVVLVDQISEALILKVSKFLAKFPEEELYYLMNFPLYDTQTTREILGENWCPEFKEYEQTFWSGYEKFVSDR
ncbi:SDR family oxidoreductase [Bdellovibrio sp. HCB-162]|uniref:SDR family oxidoreductase n=1 Tax=Bdellovibrio sp. HCB-162 TaxID=3394234 RepID=UPI0039BCDC4D